MQRIRITSRSDAPDVVYVVRLGSDDPSQYSAGVWNGRDLSLVNNAGARRDNTNYITSSGWYVIGLANGQIAICDPSQSVAALAYLGLREVT